MQKSKEAERLIFASLLSTLILCALIIKTLSLTNFNFYYTLDDPYIHLALSDQISNGHYGLIPDVPASPSSSILYPFILALFSSSNFHILCPLIIGWLSLVASTLILYKIAKNGGLTDWTLLVVIFLVMLSSNFFGLPLNGMEHGLHVTVTLWTLYGLIKIVNNEPEPVFFLTALITSPLIRYEGLSVAIGGMIVLALYRRWTAVFISFTSILILMSCFTALLYLNNLPLIPNSIILKSKLAAIGHINILETFLLKIQNSLNIRQGIILILLWLTALAGLLLKEKKISKDNYALAIFISIVDLGHTLSGHFGWFSRYEIYAYISTIVVIFWTWRTQLSSNFRDKSFRSLMLVSLFLAAIGLPYIETTLNSPKGAQEIYLQQAQMRKFAIKYHKNRVAVNDIGLISYRNPYPITDLWGLGYGRPEFIDKPWMNQQAVTGKANVVMIYKKWFENSIPDNWIYLGILKFERDPVSVAENSVVFYLTEPSYLNKSKEELNNFITDLPENSRFISAI